MKMIYFDNAATTFPKPYNVIREVNRCIKKYCGNPGRSGHKLALETAEKVYSTRELLAGFLDFDSPERIVFTCNSTYALNLAIKTSITERCHVISSDSEHNSVLRPLYDLKSSLGIEISFFTAGGDLREKIKPLIRDDTKAIICTLMSNVTGVENSLEVLSNIRKENNLLLIVDASQAVGHKPISLKDFPCDIFCAPGHKSLFGIQGAGFAVFCDERHRKEFILGGTGIDSKKHGMPKNLPERYEAGTLPVPPIVSIGAGINYINYVGINEIEHKITVLTEKTIEMLDSIKGISYTGYNGIISFNLEGVPSSVVASLLDGYGICVRSGFHCAPIIHKSLGTEKYGTARISFSYLNKVRQLDKLYQALKQISREI